MALEANKCRVKVLLWNQAKEPLGAGKFNPMWHGPYVVKRVLEKGAYELVDYEGTALVEPRNGLCPKKILCMIFS